MGSLTATMGAQLIQTRQTQVHVGVACLMKTQMAMELPSASTTVLMIPTSQSQETVDVAFQKQTCLVTLTVMAITTLMTPDSR